MKLSDKKKMEHPFQRYFASDGIKDVQIIMICLCIMFMSLILIQNKGQFEYNCDIAMKSFRV